MVAEDDIFYIHPHKHQSNTESNQLFFLMLWLTIHSNINPIQIQINCYFDVVAEDVVSNYNQHQGSVSRTCFGCCSGGIIVVS